jgi:predicted dehydrogenase
MTVKTSTAGRKVPRIAVVGTGWWTTRVHLPALLANKGCEVVTVADVDPGRGAYVVGHAFARES